MDVFWTLFGIVSALLGLYAIFLLCVRLPMQMAEDRGRDPYKWLIVSIFFSPLVAIFLLWLLEDR